MQEEMTRSQERGNGQRSIVLSHLLALASFLVLQVTGTRFPWLLEKVFLLPSAKLSSLSLGVPVSITEHGIRLHHDGVEVAITEACSGFDFFCLVAGLWLGRVLYVSGCSPRSAWLSILAPLVAWPVTLIGNVSRIVSATGFRALTSGVFPSSYDGVIHQSIGVVVFLSTLIAFWFFLTKQYERFSRA